MFENFVLDDIKESLDEVYKKITLGDHVLRNIEICLMMAKGTQREDIAQKYVLSYTRICDVINSACAFIMYMLHLKHKRYYKMFERVTAAGRHVVDYRRFVSPEGVAIFEYLKNKAKNDTHEPYSQKILKRYLNCAHYSGLRIRNDSDLKEQSG